MMEERQAPLLSRVRALHGRVSYLQSRLPLITYQIFCALSTTVSRIKHEWHILPNEYKPCAFVSFGFFLPPILVTMEYFGRHGTLFLYYWSNYFAASLGDIDRTSACSKIMKNKGPSRRFAPDWQSRFRRGCEGNRDGLFVQGYLLLEGLINPENGFLAMAAFASWPVTILQWMAVLAFWIILYDLTVITSTLSLRVVNRQCRPFLISLLTLSKALLDLLKGILKGLLVDVDAQNLNEEDSFIQDQQTEREHTAPTQPAERYEDGDDFHDFDMTDQRHHEAANILARHGFGYHSLDDDYGDDADDVLGRQSQSVLFKAMRDLSKMGFGFHALGRGDEFRGKELDERSDRGMRWLLNHGFDIFGFENDAVDEKDQKILQEAISFMNKRKLKVTGSETLQFPDKGLGEHAEKPLQEYSANFNARTLDEQLYQPYRPPQIPRSFSQVGEGSQDLGREVEAQVEPALHRSSWQRYGRPPVPGYPGESSQAQHRSATETPTNDVHRERGSRNQDLEEREEEDEERFVDTNDQIQAALDFLYSIRPMDFEDDMLQNLRHYGLEVGNLEERGYIQPYRNMPLHMFNVMVELARQVCQRNWIAVAPWHVEQPGVFDRFFKGNRASSGQILREAPSIDQIEGRHSSSNRDHDNQDDEDENGGGGNTKQDQEEEIQPPVTNVRQRGDDGLMPLHEALQDALDTLVQIGSEGYNLNYLTARGFQMGDFEKRAIKRRIFADQEAEKATAEAALQLLLSNGIKVITRDVEYTTEICDRAVQDAIDFLYREGVRWREPILGVATARGWQIGHLEERGVIMRPIEERYFLQAMIDALNVLGVNDIHPFQIEVADESVLETFLNGQQTGVRQEPLLLSRRFQQNFLNLLYSRLYLPDSLIAEWQGLGFTVGDLEEQGFEPPILEQGATGIINALEDAIVFLRIQVPRHIYDSLRDFRIHSHPEPLTREEVDNALKQSDDELVQRMHPGGPGVRLDVFSVPYLGYISEVRSDEDVNQALAIPEHDGLGPAEQRDWRLLPIPIANPEFEVQDGTTIALADGRHLPHGAAGFFSPYALPSLGEEEEEEEEEGEEQEEKEKEKEKEEDDGVGEEFEAIA